MDKNKRKGENMADSKLYTKDSIESLSPLEGVAQYKKLLKH